jgi:L-2-hydroxyglutarate oxidase
MKYDFAIVGGGIVGLATTLALCERYPKARIVVLEKEPGWATHQTGHNSGVIHSGIYYKPGSFKAKLAREGNRAMQEFCRTHGLRHEVCGKVIVATAPEELPLLDNLYERGLANGLTVRKIGVEELQEIEPHVCGLAALQVHSAGITDYRQVAQTLASLLHRSGVDLRLATKVESLSAHGDGVTVETNVATFQTGFLINCAGLYSDHIARLASVSTDVKIVPFRGEYYTIRPERRSLVKHLIYPVPDPGFPFLGVHFTRMIDGDVHAGPNAVLSLRREGYRKTDFHLAEFVETLAFPGFWRLAARNCREGAKELFRSLSKAAFVRSLQRLIPEVRAEDLLPGGAGVRAQALLRDGRLVDDFLIVRGLNSIHVCNAPSPAATASLEIGKYLTERIAEQISTP